MCSRDGPHLRVIASGCRTGLSRFLPGWRRTAGKRIHWLAQFLLATALGLSLVVASGCAFNNCIDRDIDGRMERTRNRVTVTGEMSLAAAFAHALVLGVAGFALLIWQTNPTAVFFIIYYSFCHNLRYFTKIWEFTRKF